MEVCGGVWRYSVTVVYGGVRDMDSIQGLEEVRQMDHAQAQGLQLGY